MYCLRLIEVSHFFVSRSSRVFDLNLNPLPFFIVKNKLMSVFRFFHASALLLTMNFVITLSK